ncbi:MAG: SUMF1/EgtB/PvdO family nonheme iron enzyme [Opitutales bacterium]
MATFFKIFGIVALFVGALSGVYYVSVMHFHSRDILGVFAQREGERELTPEAQAEMEDQVNQLEDNFRAILRLRAPEPDDLQLIEEAVELQREIVNAQVSRTGPARERLDELEAFYFDQAGRALRLESDRHEQLADQALDEEDVETAKTELQNAIDLQNEINRSYSQSEYASVRRQSDLQRELRTLEREPTHEASLAAEAAARRAMEAEEWERAAAKLEEAIETQESLNSGGQMGGYADHARLSRLRQDLASLESRDLGKQIEELERTGRELTESGDLIGAAERFHVALRLQEQLNRDHPQSRFAGERRLTELSERYQQAQSEGLAAEILAEVRAVDEALRRGTVLEGLSEIDSLVRKATAFREDFPGSRQVDGTLLSKLEYLAFMRAEVGFYQRRIEGQLLPIPGAGNNARMLRTEVSQALYSSIMLNNPSRQRGDLLPVDSVTYAEALAFCQRVGWLFGREARLPRRAEFEAAVGSLRYVDLREIAWCAQNTQGTSQPVATRAENAHGFCDLLGNVREWCEPEGFVTDGEALLVGGSASDSVDLLAEIPAEIVSKRTRNRLSGFRFVLETASPSPGEAPQS